MDACVEIDRCREYDGDPACSRYQELESVKVQQGQPASAEQEHNARQSGRHRDQMARQQGEGEGASSTTQPCQPRLTVASSW